MPHRYAPSLSFLPRRTMLKHAQSFALCVAALTVAPYVPHLSVLALAQTAYTPIAAKVSDPSQKQAGLVSRFVSEAKYWLSQQQFEHALDTVERALNIEPHNPQALLLLGTIQKRQGDITGAEKTLSLMQAAGVSSTYTQQLHDVLDAPTVNQDKLAQARAIAATGKMLQASMAYKALFAGKPPPDMALEYYSVLGSTILGYQEAVTKLQGMLQHDPKNLDMHLLYNRILTYRETSRPAGLEGLKRLALSDISPRIRQQAYAAWRQTLLWEAIRGSSIPLYYEWLSQHPKDTEIADRLEKAREVQKRFDADNSRVDGYSFLNTGRLDDATKGFQNALSYNDKDAAALGGLGLIAERQHNWHQAENYFQQAMAADPATANQWQGALVGLKKSMAGNNPLSAQIARSIMAHRYDEARQNIARLAQQSGQQENALLLRAQLEMREGHRAEAEEAYRAALAHGSHNTGALVTLVTLLLQDNRLEEAEDILWQSGNRHPDLMARVQSARFVQQAEQETNADERIALLRQAVAATPQDAWVRLKLAQALAANNQAVEGQAVMQEVVSRPRPSQEALAAGIIYADGQNDFATSAALLKRMPRTALSPDMHQLLERANAGLDISAIEQNDTHAVAGLKALARKPDTSGYRSLLIADALIKHDDIAGAYAVLQQGQTQAQALSPSQRLSFAGLYLRILAMPGKAGFHKRVRQDIARCLNDFDAQVTTPTPEEAEARSKIEDGFVAIQADNFARQGLSKDARFTLEHFIATHPDALESRLALSRVYAAQDMPERALAEDLKVLQTKPDNPRVLGAAVHDATMADNTSMADSLSQRLQTVAPNARETWQAIAESASARDDMRAQQVAVQHLQTLQCADNESDACEVSDVLRPDYRWPVIEGSYKEQQGVLLPSSAHYLPEDSAEEATQRNIVHLHDALSTQLDGNIFIRSRSGVAEMGRLTELADPVTLSVPFESWNHRISFSISPTFLFSGNLSSHPASDHQLGKCATVSSVFCQGPIQDAHGKISNQFAGGIGLNVNYVNRWFSADVGSTPLGFPIVNIVGGLEFAPHLTRNLVLRMSGGRRMVTDSELSYAGQRDPVYGHKWGGVTRDYGHGMLEWGHPLWSLYAGAGFAYLDGTHVVSNTELDVEAGVNAIAWQDKEKRQTVRTGLDFSYYDYHRNSYLFSWGQGGYFSPQGYYAIMVPVTWQGHYDRWTWLLRGEGGFQHYHSDAADYFPLNDGLQPKAQGIKTEGAQSASGAAGNVMGRIVYQITPSLRLGAQIGYSRAGSWSEVTGMLLAHYTLDGF